MLDVSTPQLINIDLTDSKYLLPNGEIKIGFEAMNKISALLAKATSLRDSTS